MHNQIDIQATQGVISLFESSKAHSEEALETLPGIYAVIDEGGMIYKGNNHLARLFGTGFELLLGQKFSQLFHAEQWSTFQSNLKEARSRSDASSSGIDFRSDLQPSSSETMNYFWNVRPLTLKQTGSLQLFTVIGRDVTDLNRATAEKTRLQVELNTAKTMQEMLFPPTFAKFGSSEIGGSYESATECGGDWWHYAIKGKHLNIYIGDVTGHGMAAALLTGTVRGAVSVIEGSPGKVPLGVNDQLKRLNAAVFSSGKSQRNMTFCIASVDLETGKCVYANASHMPIYKISAKTKTISALLAPPGSPLGDPGDFDFEERTVDLDKGDRLFFYTDGLIDLLTGPTFDISRPKLHRILRAVSEKCQNIETLIHELNREFGSIRGKDPLVDDVTFVSFQF